MLSVHSGNQRKIVPRTDPRAGWNRWARPEIYTLITRDYDNAKKIFERLLVIQEERFGPEHIQVADTLYGMG